MSILPALAATFSPPVRARGEQYHRDGRVQLVATTDAHIDARVHGTRSYVVSLRLQRRGTVSMTCDCPYIEEWGEACKHLWATVLEAAERGHPLVSDGVAPRTARPAHGAPPARVPSWRRELDRLRAVRPEYARLPAPEPVEWPATRRLAYVVDGLSAFGGPEGIVVELATQAPRTGGGWGAPKRFGYSQAHWLAAPDAVDREIAQMLLGATETDDVGDAYYGPPVRSFRRFRVAASAFDTTLRRICETGRCFIRLRADRDDPPPLAWDDGGTWALQLTLVPHGDGRCRLAGTLARGEERVPLETPVLLVPGLAVRTVGEHEQHVAATVRDDGAGDLALVLRAGRTIAASTDEAAELVAELAERYPRLAPVELPAWLGLDAVQVRPTPQLTLQPTPRAAAWHAPRVDAVLAFDYDGVRVDAGAAGTTFVAEGSQRIVHRDLPAERAALGRLEQAGVRREHDQATGRHVHRLPATRAAAVAVALTGEGWVVELEGQRVRQAGAVSLEVRSRIDWFDLHGTADFGGVTAALPELLAALRRGERTVVLRDGSVGVIPEAWLDSYGLLAALGTATRQGVRFTRGQTALLDALLATVPQVSADERFAQAREELRRFSGVTPLDPPPGFTGALRPYQREGLGWLDVLQRLGLGGILADDMGLGKTVQALALLEMRRQAGAGPSLVVMPRSLVFNWQQEAARFAPQLRVLVYHGPQRRASLERLRDHDLVLTTYGTLRRDAVDFKDVEFDHAILDEAQAIKNATTATAKAARLIRARHRVAMSGTPIENRLDELWSQFEFLNPGMLGASAAFQRLARRAGGEDANADAGEIGSARALVARAVRPYILRRTKEQVARELPERVEQTVWVDLVPAERRLYDELRDHYRAALLGRVDSHGLAKSKIHVLEALLRLRQAACHPGLVDRERATDTSSKLDVLFSRLSEAVARGHKALVFSQFTSLLAIVRARLDAEGVPYEYLDGRTRDRQRRVERFQGDAALPVFLVSLKAGGLGLNLTAADYVFLLDPWWNPAVEAQAIDRAHRIGQTRNVLAARLVARDTVEEKVIELQRSKRDLADAIVRADDGLVAGLTREDLELLLG